MTVILKNGATVFWVIMEILLDKKDHLQKAVGKVKMFVSTPNPL